MTREDIEAYLGKTKWNRFVAWMIGKPFKVRFDGSIIYDKALVEKFKLMHNRDSVNENK